MPIPAPGTAELLKGVPLAASPIKAELTTPTGAAILTTIVNEWVETPVMTVEPHRPRRRQARVRRAAEHPAALRRRRQPSRGPESDQVWVLETNLDDLPAEVIGYCYERLLDGRRPRCLQHAHRHEEEPARRAC